MYFKENPKICTLRKIKRYEYFKGKFQDMYIKGKCTFLTANSAEHDYHYCLILVCIQVSAKRLQVKKVRGRLT
jgi:hypothetical protein